MLRMRVREALTEPYFLERLSKYPIEGEWMFAACIANNTKKRMNEKYHLGINVGKRKCRAAVKDDKGKILDEFFFDNDANGISNLLSRVKTNGTHSTTTTQAVLDSTGNMWMRIHDKLEENDLIHYYLPIHTRQR